MAIPFVSPTALSGFASDTPLLVAFSGGADSRLLLELTTEWARSTGAPVTAAHLHHGIRGAEADRDEAFCRETAAALGASYVCRRVDIPALAAQNKRSIELEARMARYDFFADVMRERGIPLLLTAHHADDQLETLLLRCLRGVGTRGLAGIPPVRSVPGGLLLRPLLTATRRDILTACQERGLTFVTDSTNLDDACMRNRLRHRVVPILEEIAGMDAPQHAVTRLCSAAREDEDFLNVEAERIFPTLSTAENGTLSVSALQSLHPALAKRCMLRAYAEARAQETLSGEHSLEAIHLQALAALVQTGREGSAASLPGDWQGMIRGGRLLFQQAGGQTCHSPPSCGLTADGTSLLPGDTLWYTGKHTFRIRAETAELPFVPDTGANVVAFAVFPANLPQPLSLRRRRPGDTILSHGMNKKIKKLMCDKRIPPDLRDALPLVCLPAASDTVPTPLWIPTVAFRDGWQAPASGACLRLTVYDETAHPHDKSHDSDTE